MHVQGITPCEYNWGGWHKKSCQRCSWTRQANDLRVPIHEWPLPDDESEARNVVFELQAPPIFCTWRDITYGLLHDICTPKGSWPSAVTTYEQLDTYNPLFPHSTWKNETRRIGMASGTKSFEASHYRFTTPRVSSDAVCRPNGLQFRLHDSLHHLWATDAFSCDVSLHSTFRLPTDSPYRSLQFSVNGTKHTPNFVLANQSECAQELEINEFIAFGTLRAGGRLQWLNIMREIAAKSLSLERWEVQILIMQSIWQIGLLDQDSTLLLDWHEESKNTRFCQNILGVLDGLHRSIEANWMQMKAAHTATLIACRLLAFAKEAQIRKDIFALICRIRKTIHHWMRDLSNKLWNSDDEGSIGDLQVRLCEAAASCRATYDVEGANIEDAFRAPEDVAVLIECSITLCDNKPPTQSLSSRSDIKHLLDRDRRLARSLAPCLAARISRDPSILRTSLQTIWTSCPADIRFEQITTPNDSWFASVPRIPNSSEPHVHLNILTGQLLVNGKPTSRLPREISEHPMFHRLFGSVGLPAIADTCSTDIHLGSPRCHSNGETENAICNQGPYPRISSNVAFYKRNYSNAELDLNIDQPGFGRRWPSNCCGGQRRR